ncbi:hypothetical protein NL676_029628 [Syzygium grande]|nr:hypothetical protein NL676_029628 [Syzygium grande]
MSELDVLAIVAVGDKVQDEESHPKRTQLRDIMSIVRRTKGLQDGHVEQRWTCYAQNNLASEAIEAYRLMEECVRDNSKVKGIST